MPCHHRGSIGGGRRGAQVSRPDSGSPRARACQAGRRRSSQTCPRGPRLQRLYPPIAENALIMRVGLRGLHEGTTACNREKALQDVIINKNSYQVTKDIYTLHARGKRSEERDPSLLVLSSAERDHAVVHRCNPVTKSPERAGSSYRLTVTNRCNRGSPKCLFR